MTHLNDLTKAYLEQIAEKKKDDTYLEPDMKKRQANNEKARKELAKGPQMKNPHFEEKKLDPVGQEDSDIDNDGDVDSSDKYLKKRRKAIGKAMKKESFLKSDWRDSLSEVMTDIESKPIKEKKVNNKIKINPTMGEAIEEIGGTLIEEIEIEDIEGVVECVYSELIEEGYTEDEVESAIEQSLTEAKITYGHDTSDGAERMRDKLKKKAKGFLGKVAVKAYNKAREAKAATTPAVQRAKTSAKRGIRKMAQKVVDRMSEEIVGEAVYGGTKKPAPTDKRLVVTNADKAGNTPAYQKYKAGDKNYKAADHMKEGVRDVDPEKGTAERKARLEKKRGMKMDDHPQYKKEEKDPFGRPGGKHGGVPKKGGGYDKAYQANMKKIKELEQKEEVEVDEAMSSYDRNRKRAAQRAADRNAARAAGKTGVVPGVGYVSPRKEKETYVDSAGTTRHKSGAKMEEVEMDEAMRPGERQRKMAAKRHDPYASSRDRGTAHNVAVRGDVSTGDPAIKSRGGGGVKKDKGMGYGDRGAGNKARRRAGQEPLRGTRTEEASMSPQEVQLQKKKAMLDKMIATKRMQGLKGAKKSEEPTKAMGEGKELSIDDQMRISREANAKRKPYQPGDREKQRAAQIRQMAKNASKDTRTDAQKMADATGPRPGSRYRGD